MWQTRPRQIQRQPTEPQAGHPPHPPPHPAPTESQCVIQGRGLLEGGVWEQAKAVCVLGWGWGSRSGGQRVREAATQTYAPQSPQTGEAHNTLAVSQGLAGRKWEGTEQETELPGAAWGPQFTASPTDSSPRLPGHSALRALSEGSSCLPKITARSEMLSTQRRGDGKFQKPPYVMGPFTAHPTDPRKQ